MLIDWLIEDFSQAWSTTCANMYGATIRPFSAQDIWQNFQGTCRYSFKTARLFYPGYPSFCQDSSSFSELFKDKFQNKRISTVDPAPKFVEFLLTQEMQCLILLVTFFL